MGKVTKWQDGGIMKRRVFIQNLFLLSGAVALIPNTGYAFAPVRQGIKGTVTSQGKGLANVSVSDGFSVVRTNRKGKYELPYNRAAKFVFISIPAGYVFPHERSIVRHYHTLDGRRDYDFQLVPLSADDSKHNFIIWADPQVRDEADVTLMMSKSVPDVQMLLREMGPHSLVHGIGVGDLVWDAHPLFERYEEAVATMGIPFFQVVGNHDMDYNKGGDDVSDNTFEAHYGPAYYSFNRGQVHYVVLDDVRYLGTDRKYDGYISEQQLNWLKLDLEQVPADNLIIVSVHIPVHTAVKNNSALYALLEPFKKVHIMSGHTHYNRNVMKNGVYEHNHGTVCGAWWTGDICTDGTPNGYGVYEVNGTDLKWYYKGTGRDRNDQLSLHVEQLTNQKRVLANVWNWDPEWKVEWWADNKYMGLLENTEGYDMEAVKKFKGKNLPLKRSFAEPSRTDHLFMAHVNSDIKEIKVVATDRFGQRYEQNNSV